MKSRLPERWIVGPQGKTKVIFFPPDNNVSGGKVFNLPFVTAGDGRYREYIPEKDVYVTATTCNIFSLLRRHGVLTHFQEKIDESIYLVKLLQMIPIEIVVRRIAFGSYLKRNPHMKEGVIFMPPLVEFFYKNDAMSDPMMLWYPMHHCFRLYHPHEPPEARGHIGELNGNDPLIPHTEEEVEQLQVIAMNTFRVLEDAFKRVGITLVDFKIECGYDENRKLYVADQIDGDSCRLWEGGNKHKAIDKDRYRAITKTGRTPTTEERERIAKDYRDIATITDSFGYLVL